MCIALELVELRAKLVVFVDVLLAHPNGVFDSPVELGVLALELLQFEVVALAFAFQLCCLLLESANLSLQLPHHVRLQTRPPLGWRAEVLRSHGCGGRAVVGVVSSTMLCLLPSL